LLFIVFWVFSVNVHHPTPTTDRNVALLIGGWAIAAAALGLWAGGMTAIRLWCGAWPAVRPSGALGLLARTLAAGRHPEHAWPPTGRLPPSGVLGLAEAAGAAVGLAIAAPVVVLSGRAGARGGPTMSPRRLARLRRRLLPRPPVPSRGGWARRRDLSPLTVHGPASGRLTLGWLARTRTPRGTVHGRLTRWRFPLLAAEPRASVVVLGPSQSGKTTGLAIPAILEWQGPVVATSVKADLARDTFADRAAAAPAWVYDPTGTTRLPGAGWSPLAACSTWQGARRTAAWLCGAARSPGGSGVGDEEFWYAAAGKLLAPYLLAATVSGCDMGQVVRWIDTQEEPAVAQVLDEAGETEALVAAGASWQRDERTRSSVFTTAEMVLDAYADPSILASATRSDISPARLLAGDRSTLYVCAPGHEQERLRPVFATLLQTVITAAYDTSLARGGPLDPPLLIVLDEAANIAPLRDLDALASTAAGHGVQLVTVWQDLAQVRARYGERAATVVNNHRAKVVLSGIADPATLEYASRLIGDAEVGDQTVTVDPTGARSTTRSRRERRLAPDAELRRIRPGEGVLVYGHLPPARIRLRLQQPGPTPPPGRSPPVGRRLFSSRWRAAGPRD